MRYSALVEDMVTAASGQSRRVQKFRNASVDCVWYLLLNRTCGATAALSAAGLDLKKAARSVLLVQPSNDLGNMRPRRIFHTRMLNDVLTLAQMCAEDDVSWFVANTGHLLLAMLAKNSQANAELRKQQITADTVRGLVLTEFHMQLGHPAMVGIVPKQLTLFHDLDGHELSMNEKANFIAHGTIAHNLGEL